jgi:hypothetical protein
MNIDHLSNRRIAVLVIVILVASLLVADLLLAATHVIKIL